MDQQGREVEIVRVATKEHEEMLAELVEVFASDSSRFDGQDIGPFSRFGNDVIARCWSEPDDHAFLVRVASEWAGFIFVNHDREVGQTDAAMTISELFLLKKYRHVGVEEAAAKRLFALFPKESWDVKKDIENTEDGILWGEIIQRYGKGDEL